MNCEEFWWLKYEQYFGVSIHRATCWQKLRWVVRSSANTHWVAFFGTFRATFSIALYFFSFRSGKCYLRCVNLGGSIINSELGSPATQQMCSDTSETDKYKSTSRCQQMEKGHYIMVYFIDNWLPARCPVSQTVNYQRVVGQQPLWTKCVTLAKHCKDIQFFIKVWITF